MKLRLFSVLAAVSLWMGLCTPSVHAQVPRTINYQGYLTTPTGAPVNSPGLQMVFNLYNVAASGSALHTETQTVVVNNGIFNVLLGSAATLSLPFDVQYYLGVTPGADAEMSPRQPLAASPYAIRALTATSALTANSAITATTANSATTATTATTANSATTATTATAATTAASADALSPSATVPGSQISNASITAAKLASSGCTGNQVLQYNGSAWICVTLPTPAGGTVTSIATGTGLEGGPITTSGTIAVDFSIVQPRITNGCPVGSSIRSINGNGVATCQNVGNATLSVPLPNTTTTIQAVGSDYGKFASLAISGDGLPFVAFYRGSVMSLLKCGNPECNANNDVMDIEVAIPITAQNAITIGADGIPVIVYQGGNGLKLARCQLLACTGVFNISTIGSISATGSHPSVVIGADGFPIIAVSSNSNVLRLIKCNNAACTTSSVNTLTGSVQGQIPTLALGVDGLPIIAYSGPNSSGIGVVKCINATCTGAPQLPTFVPDVGFNGTAQRVSLTIGEDGLPVMSYASGSSLAVLTVAKCTRLDCPFFLTNDIEVGGVGLHSSITIGVDGLPVISYYDTTNGDLKFVRCVDFTCQSANNTYYPVATTGNVGQYTSIGIGGDGRPVIAYYDVTNLQLKVTKCGSKSCTPYLRPR